MTGVMNAARVKAVQVPLPALRVQAVVRQVAHRAVARHQVRVHLRVAVALVQVARAAVRVPVQAPVAQVALRAQAQVHRRVAVRVLQVPQARVPARQVLQAAAEGMSIAKEMKSVRKVKNAVVENV